MNSTSADALFTSSTSAVGMSGAGARADAGQDAARAAPRMTALRALLVIRRSARQFVPTGIRRIIELLTIFGIESFAQSVYWKESGMWRAVVIIVAVLTAYDLYMLDGRYTSAGVQMSASILHFFRVM